MSSRSIRCLLYEVGEEDYVLSLDVQGPLPKHFDQVFVAALAEALGVNETDVTILGEEKLSLLQA